MTLTGELFISALLGALLGVFFWGGLLWTVTRGLQSRRPALLFLPSYLVRAGCVVMGLYLVSSGDVLRLLACFLGFLLMRVFFTRAVRKKNES